MRHRTDHLRRARLVAACLVTLLFLLPVPTAHAEPTLSATPTVVTFKSTTDVGVTTLSWSSGSPESVQVHVKVDSGSFTPTGLSGPTGSSPYNSIQYGKTHTFRLFGANGRTIVSTRDVVVTTKLEKVQLEFGCLAKCIVETGVDPHGTYADFTAATNVEATFIVQAVAAPPNKDGTCPSSPLAGTLWKSTKSKTFSGQMQHLDAGTKHCYTVIAKDSAGNEQKVHNPFTTHKRFVTVTIDKIFILNDSDPSDSAEIKFFVQVHDIKDNGAVPETDLETGDSVHPNLQYSAVNVPNFMTITVFGSDDDGPFDTWENAEAVEVLDVTGPGGPPEAFDKPKPLVMSSKPLDGSNLYFTVSGTFNVTYAP